MADIHLWHPVLTGFDSQILKSKFLCETVPQLETALTKVSDTLIWNSTSQANENNNINYATEALWHLAQQVLL